MFCPWAATDVSLCVNFTKGRKPAKIWMLSRLPSLAWTFGPRSWICDTTLCPGTGLVSSTGTWVPCSARSSQLEGEAGGPAFPAPGQALTVLGTTGIASSFEGESNSYAPARALSTPSRRRQGRRAGADTLGRRRSDTGSLALAPDGG